MDLDTGDRTPLRDAPAPLPSVPGGISVTPGALAVDPEAGVAFFALTLRFPVGVPRVLEQAVLLGR